MRWCRRKNIDTVIDLELFSRFTALLTGSSGARNRVGFHAFHNEGLYRGDLLTHKVAYNPFQHIAKNFVALVHALQQDPEQVPLLKRVIADEEVQLARATVSVDQRALVLQAIARRVPAFRSAETRVILVNANSSDLLPQRRWPRAYFAEAIRALLAWDARILVLLTGSPGEAAEADDLARGIADPRCVSFAGAIAFEQLPHLYSVSECMLTNDSGPGHFAAITAMHTFVIFGPETPALYGSLGSTTPIYAGMACSPCVSAANHRRTPCRDNRCVQVITPSSVVQTMCAWLADRSAPEEALAVREIPRGTPGTRIPAAEGHPIARE
ncbi:MAG: glycosyltransferase family 9 protein [Planctomycetota bacterium]